MGPLRNRQHEKFCLEMASLRTQADAYAAAGYAPDAANAAKLGRRPEVKARIRELQDEAVAFSNVRRERIVVELDRIGSANILDFYETVKVRGKSVERLRPISAWPRNLAAVVQSVEVNPATGEVLRIKFHDKLGALTTLLKYLGGLTEAPAAPNFNIFDGLTADEQRAFADIVDTVIRERDQPQEPEQPARDQHLH